jgi:hypothetical protein
LTEWERRGGIVANGGSLIPEAAVFMTWFHASSPKVFRNMRFLVCQDAYCDIIIGARTIHKHNLLSEPNFGLPGNQVGGADLGKGPYPLGIIT